MDTKTNKHNRINILKCKIVHTELGKHQYGFKLIDSGAVR